jgi:hypothetical protein
MRVECRSHPDVSLQSVKCVRKWGTACLVGVNALIKVLVANLTFKQVDVIVYWNFSNTGQSECAECGADRGVDVDALCS